MANLSRHQFSALVALLVGPRSNRELAAELGITEHAVRPMMLSLRDRGLVAPLGKRRTPTQRPSHFTYVLTEAGRLQAQGDVA